MNSKLKVRNFKLILFVTYNGIALSLAVSDYNNQMITLSNLLFPLNEDSFKKGCDLNDKYFG